MSDPDLNDQMDDAYRRAEAVLGDDDDARAARRARVLAAVTTEAGAAPSLAKRARRLHPAWMATAAAVALSVIVAVNIPKPIQVPPPAPVPSLPPSPPVTAPASPSAASSTVAAPQTADTVRKSTAISGQAVRALEGAMRPPPSAAPSRMATKPVMATPPPSVPPLPLPPVPAPVAESPRPPPSSAPPPTAPAPPTPSASAPTERNRAEPQSAKSLSERQPSTAGRLANASSDPAERMQAAAAAGRTTEVEALLAQGVPVDAADGEGETALMKSVRADHPATAALLRRRGASLDHANKSGETVRDLAAAKADAQLDKALDLPR